MNKSHFYDFLRKIPKAEIHLHAEATISRATVKKLLDRSGNPDSVKVESLYQFNTLKGFLTSFLFVQSLIKELSDLDHMFEDAATYLRQNNIVYAELFFSPTGLIKKGLKFSDMIDVIQKTITRVQKRDKLTIKLIIDVSRMFGVENAHSNLELTLKHKTPMILGVGLGGDEEFGPAITFEEVFQLAKAKGLHVVAHAGEVVGPQSIWDALQKLQVQRIGHGLSATQDPKLVAYLAEHQVPIEICLTSNIITQKYVTMAEHHPVRQLFDQGVLTVINTDDPSFFDVSLIDEFWTLHTKLNFTMAEIKQLVINGFKASFLTDAKKTAYIKQVEKAWLAASEK